MSIEMENRWAEFTDDELDSELDVILYLVNKNHKAADIALATEISAEIERRRRTSEDV